MNFEKVEALRFLEGDGRAGLALSTDLENVGVIVRFSFGKSDC